jgi:hypothetical protein
LFTAGSNNNHTGGRAIDPVDFGFDPEARGNPGFQPQGVADLSWNEHDHADDNEEMASYESESGSEEEEAAASDSEEEAVSDSDSEEDHNSEVEEEQDYNSEAEEEEDYNSESEYDSDDEVHAGVRWTTRFHVGGAGQRSLTQPVLELMMDMLFAQGTPCSLQHAGRGTVEAESESQHGLSAANLAINRFLGRGDLEEMSDGMAGLSLDN